MKAVCTVLLAVYLGLAPVYWLPGVDAELLATFKIALFVFTAALVALWSLLAGRIRAPRGILGPLGLVLLFLSMTGGLLQSELPDIASTVKDCLLVFSALWMFYLLGQLGCRTSLILTLAAFVVAGFCALVASSRYLGSPDFAGPRQFVAPHLWVSGFGSLRTGWSNGVALYVAPLLLVLSQRNTPQVWFAKCLALAGVGAIVLSQLAVGGRAGLIAAALIIILGCNSPGKRWLLGVTAVIGAVFILSHLGDFYLQMRITRSGPSASHTVDDLNTISAGRLEGDALGIAQGLEDPLSGHGLAKAMIGRDEIHNLWIRLFVESGLLAPLTLLLITMTVLRAAWSTTRAHDTSKEQKFRANVVLAGLIAGMFMTLVEPRMLLGTFQISIMWWALAGVAAYECALRARQAGRRQQLVQATDHGTGSG